MTRNVNLDYKGEHRAVRLCRQFLTALQIHLNVLQQELSHQHPINIIISSQVVRSKKVDAHLRFNLIGL